MVDDNIELCDENETHQQEIDNVLNHKLDDTTISELTDLFKILGDPTRIKILYSLSLDELCVCDIAEILNMSQSAISHQLRTLRAARLVKFRKAGKSVFYSLNDEHILTLLRQGLEHVGHN
ncbi:ArsR/SmtB family transcription factor [Calorimonas adulescens]|uniref:Winged helix-turn-helix transcriptional regulator n=1 Tax=Calorimonas adulescens TaxID=2606906 RepID=A0A5D8QDY4_9THEO|nr:metalloregulator ArsR/SmtB family transcription factor [Calorimonas adulescens]TZE82597.1 winged helix-turn-helix transcriptional regulator [Calorimonas adulescens]